MMEKKKKTLTVIKREIIWSLVYVKWFLIRRKLQCKADSINGERKRKKDTYEFKTCINYIWLADQFAGDLTLPLECNWEYVCR